MVEFEQRSVKAEFEQRSKESEQRPAKVKNPTHKCKQNINSQTKEMESLEYLFIVKRKRNLKHYETDACRRKGSTVLSYLWPFEERVTPWSIGTSGVMTKAKG